MRGIMRIILRDVKVTAGPLEINSRQARSPGSHSGHRESRRRGRGRRGRLSISHTDPGQRSENTHQSRPGHPDIEQLRLNLKLPRSWAGLLT